MSIFKVSKKLSLSMAFLMFFTSACDLSKNKNRSDDNEIAGISISVGELSPAFAPSVAEYNVEVPNISNTIQITVDVPSTSAFLLINGIVTSSGSASSAIGLDVGQNGISVRVIAANGDVRSVTINVNRLPPSSNADLLSLVNSVGDLSPEFSVDTTNYLVEAPAGTTLMTITAVSDDENASMTVNGDPVNSGVETGDLALVTGGNEFNIVVTAQDTTTIKNYLVTVNVPNNIAGGGEIGSMAQARFNSAWNLDGDNMTVAVAKLTNASLFGDSGTFDTAINITNTASNIGDVTAELLSSFNVFFIGYLSDASGNAFTEAELLAFQDWVSSGGTMIVTCDDSQYDAVCASFGYPVVSGATSPTVPTAEGQTHELFTGTIGNIVSVQMSGTLGLFPSTAGASVLAVDSSPEQNATVLELIVDAGRVILISDVDMIANFTLSEGIEIANDNDRFLAYLFKYGTRAQVNEG